MFAARTLVDRMTVVSKWFLVAATCAAGAARADDTVFTTLSGSTVGAVQLSGNSVSTWNTAAQQFNTGFNNEITGVTLGLQRIGSGGTFAIELWTNSFVSGSAVPGTLVSTLTSDSTSILNSSEVQAHFTTSATGLTKFTDYWIVFNANNVGPGQVLWSYTDSTAGAGVAGTEYIAVNDGPGWIDAYGSYRGIMEVQAIPEPGTLVLAGIGAAVAACSLRRRRRHVQRAA